MIPYNVALFVHIVGALSLFIAAGLEWVALDRMRRAQTAEQIREWVGALRPIKHLLEAGALMILVAGLYMAFVRWGWTTAWLDVALIAFLTMSVVGPRVIARRFGTIARLASEAPNGPLSVELAWQIHDPVLIRAVRTLAMADVGVVFLMTLKPDLIGSLTVMALATALGLVVSRSSGDEVLAGTRFDRAQVG